MSLKYHMSDIIFHDDIMPYLNQISFLAGPACKTKPSFSGLSGQNFEIPDLAIISSQGHNYGACLCR